MAPREIRLATSKDSAEMSLGVCPSQDNRPMSSTRPLSGAVQQSEESLSTQRSSGNEYHVEGL